MNSSTMIYKRFSQLARASLLALTGLLVAAPLAQAEEGPEAPVFHEQVGNLPSVQRGARDFMNYCSGCHSLKYQRYSRLAADVGIPEDVLKANLMFTSEKIGDTIVSAMPAAAKDWFGRQPPDLSLETKARGSEWVNAYLQSFYLDDKRPSGVNNLFLPGVSMPHVLAGLQGWQKPVMVKKEEGGVDKEVFDHFELAQKGTMTPEEYKHFVADLTNFLAYVAEPVKTYRIHKGLQVMVYLFVLLLLTYLLKKEFWRDIH